MEKGTTEMAGPIFPSGCEGKLGVALESLQGKGTEDEMVGWAHGLDGCESE